MVSLYFHGVSSVASYGNERKSVNREIEGGGVEGGGIDKGRERYYSDSGDRKRFSLEKSASEEGKKGIARRNKDLAMKGYLEKPEYDKVVMRKFAEERKIIQRKEVEREQRVRGERTKGSENKKSKKNFLDGSEKEQYKFLYDKPLFVQMEEKFKQNIIMPEVEKNKSKLAEKRLLFQPLSHEDLQRHMKNHEDILKSQENRRKKAIYNKKIDAELNGIVCKHHSKFSLAIADEELKAKEVSDKLLEEKKKNLQKKQQYSKLVKEIFHPVVDLSKKLKIHAASTKPHKKYFLSGASSVTHLAQTDKFNEREFNSVSEPHFKPRKWKKNPMIPEKPTKKVVIKRDYLAELRGKNNEKRGNSKHQFDWEKVLSSGEFDMDKIEKIKAAAQGIDREASKHERQLGLKNKFNPNEIEKVNSLLLSSIKAKLALLEKINEN